MKRIDFLKVVSLVPLLPKIDVQEVAKEEDEFGTFDQCFEDYDLPDFDDGKGNNGYAPNVRARYAR